MPSFEGTSLAPPLVVFGPRDIQIVSVKMFLEQLSFLFDATHSEPLKIPIPA